MTRLQQQVVGDIVVDELLGSAVGLEVVGLTILDALLEGTPQHSQVLEVDLLHPTGLTLGHVTLLEAQEVDGVLQVAPVQLEGQTVESVDALLEELLLGLLPLLVQSREHLLGLRQVAQLDQLVGIGGLDQLGVTRQVLLQLETHFQPPLFHQLDYQGLHTLLLEVLFH